MGVEIKEAVNHPDHYQSDKMEVIDVIEAFNLGFCLGNVIKYVLRATRKNGIEDLKKARWYLDREIQKAEETDRNTDLDMREIRKDIEEAREDMRKEATEEIIERNGIRSEVLTLALLMEKHLRANDHKPGWRADSLHVLLDRAKEELSELEEAIAVLDKGGVASVEKEAADVANFMMMIVDNLTRGLYRRLRKD